MKRILQQVNRKLIVIASLVILIISVAGTLPTPKNGLYKNLKILPQDITKEALDKIMDVEFSDGLGVKCDYCHAKEQGTDSLDYASDANTKKEEARDMMNITMKINNENFEVKKPLIGDPGMVITCYTCHRGNYYPEHMKKDSIANINWLK